MSGMNLQFMAVGILGLITTALGAVLFFFGMLPQEVAGIFKGWALPFFLMGLVGMAPFLLTKYCNPLKTEDVLVVRLEDGGYRAFDLFSDAEPIFTPGSYGFKPEDIQDYNAFNRELLIAIDKTLVHYSKKSKPFIFLVIPDDTPSDTAGKIFQGLWDMLYSVALFTEDHNTTGDGCVAYFKKMAKSEEIKQYLNW